MPFLLTSISLEDFNLYLCCFLSSGEEYNTLSIAKNKLRVAHANTRESRAIIMFTAGQARNEINTFKISLGRARQAFDYCHVLVLPVICHRLLFA